LLEKLKAQDINFKTILADAQYDSAMARKTVKYITKPAISYRKSSKLSNALKVGKGFFVRGSNGW
jgi:hypothetical protein